jgi:hypothetical protein
MTIPTDWLIMLAISGLYLQDCALLLCRNEAILEWRRPTPRFHFGADQFRLGGKDLFISNPLTPWRPLFRLAWHVRPALAGAAGADAVEFENVARQLGGVSWPLLPIALGLFVGIPLCFRLNSDWAWFSVVAGFTYMGVAWLLVSIWGLRKAIELSDRRFASLAFEAIVCAPVALNLIRRISGIRVMHEDLVVVAKRHLPAEASRATIAEVIRRVDDDLAATDESEDDWKSLTAYRAQLSAIDHAPD